MRCAALFIGLCGGKIDGWSSPPNRRNRRYKVAVRIGF